MEIGNEVVVISQVFAGFKIGSRGLIEDIVQQRNYDLYIVGGWPFYADELELV